MNSRPISATEIWTREARDGGGVLGRHPHRPGLSPRDQRQLTDPLIGLDLIQDETCDIAA